MYPSETREELSLKSNQVILMQFRKKEKKNNLNEFDRVERFLDTNVSVVILVGLIKSCY